MGGIGAAVRTAFRLLLVVLGMVSSLVCMYFMSISLLRLSAAEPVTPVEVAKARGSCYQSTSWCTRPTPIPALAKAPLPEWGSFSPGKYFGMKMRSLQGNGFTSSTPPMGTGIMWSPSLSRGMEPRHEAQQGQLSSFEWVRHDGQHFGSQLLRDGEYGMELRTTFVVPDTTKHAQDWRLGKLPTWFQKITAGGVGSQTGGGGEKQAGSGGGGKRSLLFYFGVDCPKAGSAECLQESGTRDWKVVQHVGSAARGYDRAVSVSGYSEKLGWFCLFFMVGDTSSSASSSTSSLSFAGLRGDLLQGVDKIKHEAKQYAYGGLRPNRRKAEEVRWFDAFGDLNNVLDKDSNFVALQVRFDESTRVDAVLYDHLPANMIAQNTGNTRNTDVGIGVGDVEGMPYILSSLSSSTEVGTVDAQGEMVNLQILEPLSEEVVGGGVGTEGTKRGAGGAGGSGAGVARGVAEGAGGNGTALTHTSAMGDCVRADMEALIGSYSAAFDAHFESVFHLGTGAVADVDAGAGVYAGADAGEGIGEAVGAAGAATAGAADTAGGAGGERFTADEVEAAKVCLSSTLGGMGSFRGRPRVGAAVDVDVVPVEGGVEGEKGKEIDRARGLPPLELFTATPSRAVFPRGFLWDEGFHQLLISRWSPALSVHVLGSWLGALHYPCDPTPSGESAGSGGDCVGGWIPREMILGEEAERRVPGEFVTQRANIANPPTLLLVVEALLERFAPAPAPQVGLCTDVQKASKDLATSAKKVGVEGETEGGELASCASLALYNTDRDLVLSFLRDAYPLLHQWTQWFLHTQRGPAHYPGSFRWRGRTADGKVVPNTLASGLDDYPRGTVASTEEHHADLHCWMAKAVGVMARVEYVLEREGYPLGIESDMAKRADYPSQEVFLKSRLETLHWSPVHRGFFDVGLYAQSAHFSLEMGFRCATEEEGGGQRTRDVLVPIDVLRAQRIDFCPASHPRPLHALGDSRGGYQVMERFVSEDPVLGHIPRIGYVALFPLLLRQLDPFNPQLGAVLDMIEDPQLLWSEHGIRSIAKTDLFYQKRNSEGDAPYWRGPIWIPINYLILSGLHHYAHTEGAYMHRAAALYTSLRRNILRTVLGGYRETGFFWEQYEDDTGKGMRGHPFTGWTSLVVSIMGELY
ncbi:mannosyl oligosaccharide glucosidase-domain-containing protein [Ochromonadaceae sp. CCMP2298]|nr:mannosyl oligosaccharide glucosidase-domain-containing protein [Ochromonadaceae sp. CCMP2298]